MKNIILALSLSFFLAGLTIQAQNNGVEVKNSRFSSMLISNDNLFAISEQGSVCIWDLNTFEKSFESTDTTQHYTAIAKDKHNQIYLGTSKGRIFALNASDFTTQLHLKLKKEACIKSIFFNSLGELFLIVPYAVYDPVADKFWDDFEHEPNGMFVQKRFLFFFQMPTNKYFTMPEYCFLDSRDRIWMTKSFGEFGGSLQVFDTRKRKEWKPAIDSLNFGLLFPKSIFEDDRQNIYITSGLQHFINSGHIYKIDNTTSSVIFDGEDFKDTTNANSPRDGIFVGPGIFNPKEQKIYFATTEGFYKAAIPTEGKIKAPALLFSPELTWEREALAIGVGMTIKKLDFTDDNKLVFLTSNDGIGVYDGEKVIMLK